MRIFVLSLPKDGEKLERFRSELARTLPGEVFEIPEMFNARLFSEKRIAEVYDKEKTIKNYEAEIGKGEIGNILSQQSIFEKIAEEEEGVAAIFEDDAKISDRLKEAIPYILNWLSTNKHRPIALLLSQPSTYRLWQSTSLGDGKHRVVKVLSASGNYGYIVNAKGAKSLLALNRPISRHPKTKKINVFSIYPFLVGNYDFDRKHSNLSKERYDMWHAARKENDKVGLGLRLSWIARYYCTRLMECLTGVTSVQERSNDGLD